MTSLPPFPDHARLTFLLSPPPLSLTLFSRRFYYSGTRLIRTPRGHKRALRENVRNTCFIDIKTKADSFTNQGSVEVCGKAVNRGGGLGMEISCVYIFDGPRKHMDLLEQWLDVCNNPAIRAEDDPGRTARSKQTTSKRKKVTNSDWNKKPRKWNVCNRRQKTIVVQESNTGRKIKISKSNMSRYFVTVFFLVL